MPHQVTLLVKKKRKKSKKKKKKKKKKKTASWIQIPREVSYVTAYPEYTDQRYLLSGGSATVSLALVQIHGHLSQSPSCAQKSINH